MGFWVFEQLGFYNSRKVQVFVAGTMENRGGVKGGQVVMRWRVIKCAEGVFEFGGWLVRSHVLLVLDWLTLGDWRIECIERSFSFFAKRVQKDLLLSHRMNGIRSTFPEWPSSYLYPFFFFSFFNKLIITMSWRNLKMMMVSVKKDFKFFVLWIQKCYFVSSFVFIVKQRGCLWLCCKEGLLT